jgi:hypothetical protein
MADVMPDRQYDLLAMNFPVCQTVKLLLGPVFVEEKWAQDNDAKLATCQPRVNGLPEAVANTEGVLVVPDFKASRPEGLRQWPSYRILILACMGNEHIPFLRLDRRLGGRCDGADVRECGWNPASSVIRAP